MRTADMAREIAQGIVTEQGCMLWDAEYVREGGNMVLRLLIDKDGGVSIDDCEAVSRAVEPLLDERDPIPGPYTLEVSSAGLERPLKRPEHFAFSIGRPVRVSLYAPIDGARKFTGALISHDGNSISIETSGEVRTYDMKTVSKVNWEFDMEGIGRKK